MKILTILGSPKKNGKTSQALTLFEENTRSKGHSVHRINIKDSNLNPCLGCLACTRSDDNINCVQKDDIDEIFGKMVSSDVIVYAAPLYGWGVNSEMKAFFDRHMPLVKNAFTPKHYSFLENKNFTLLSTCLGPDQEPNTDLVKEFFNRFGNYLKGKNIQTHVIPFSMSPDYLERSKNITDKMASEIC